MNEATYRFSRNGDSSSNIPTKYPVDPGMCHGRLAPDFTRSVPSRHSACAFRFCRKAYLLSTVCVAGVLFIRVFHGRQIRPALSRSPSACIRSAAAQGHRIRAAARELVVSSGTAAVTAALISHFPVSQSSCRCFDSAHEVRALRGLPGSI